VRAIWVIGGWLSFALGMIGVVLPLLPTVPFMLLAAFCFARGSERFHDWLVNHRRFGPAIRDWHESGAISRKGKIAAVVAIALSFGVSLTVGVGLAILAVQAAVLLGVLVFILTRPDGPAAARIQSSSRPRNS